MHRCLKEELHNIATCLRHLLHVIRKKNHYKSTIGLDRQYIFNMLLMKLRSRLPNATYIFLKTLCN